MLFKTRIAEILEEQKLKQADLCRMTGIPTSLMSNYVTGKASPSLDNAELIANALGVTLDYLVGHKTAIASLPKVHSDLLEGFNVLNMEGQNLIMGVLGSLKVSHAKGNNPVVQKIIGGKNNYNVNGNIYNK